MLGRDSEYDAEYGSLVSMISQKYNYKNVTPTLNTSFCFGGDLRTSH